MEAAKKQTLHRKKRTPKDMWLVAIFQGERLNLQDIAEAGKSEKNTGASQWEWGPPGVLGFYRGTASHLGPRGARPWS